jgi:hypothetical protein
METWRHGDMDIKQETENGSPAIFLNPLPFAHSTNRSLSFVCLLTRNKGKLSVCKRTKQAKQTI